MAAALATAPARATRLGPRPRRQGVIQAGGAAARTPSQARTFDRGGGHSNGKLTQRRGKSDTRYMSGPGRGRSGPC